jgi:predicted Rossmann fold nucleotide-binding protein DprA/Smf involved in DNA uptake
MTTARTTLQPEDTRYPTALREHPLFQPATPIDCIGNLELLNEPAIGLFCSRQCPGELVNRTYDLAQRLRDAAQATIGGFHSPMEQECLRLLLRGSQPVIICPARGIQDYRVPGELRAGLDSGRLLVLSPFGADERRVTAPLAERRNHFVAAVASEVFIAYAAPDSATLRFARSLLEVGKPILTHSDPRNQSLLALGARLLQPDDISVRTDFGQMPLFDR